MYCFGGGNYSGKSRMLIKSNSLIRLASLSALPCAFHRGTFPVGGTLRAKRKRAIGFQFEFGATRLLFVFVLLSLHAAQHIGVQAADFQRGDQAAMGEAEAPHIQQRAQEPLAAQKAEVTLKNDRNNGDWGKKGKKSDQGKKGLIRVRRVIREKGRVIRVRRVIRERRG